MTIADMDKGTSLIEGVFRSQQSSSSIDISDDSFSGGQVGIAVPDGYLHPDGLGLARRCIGGDSLVRLVPGCATSCGHWRGSLPQLWRGSPANDLASRPTRTGQTPTHSHSGQFLTPVHSQRQSRFDRHPLRRRPVPKRARRGAPAARGQPLTRVTIGSIPPILRLARDLPPPSLTAAPSWLSPA